MSRKRNAATRVGCRGVTGKARNAKDTAEPDHELQRDARAYYALLERWDAAIAALPLARFPGSRTVAWKIAANRALRAFTNYEHFVETGELEFWPSAETLGLRCGQNERSVRDYLDFLEQERVVTLVRKATQHNPPRYRFNSEWLAAEEASRADDIIRPKRLGRMIGAFRADDRRSLGRMIRADNLITKDSQEGLNAMTRKSASLNKQDAGAASAAPSKIDDQIHAAWIQALQGEFDGEEAWKRFKAIYPNLGDRAQIEKALKGAWTRYTRHVVDLGDVLRGALAWRLYADTHERKPPYAGQWLKACGWSELLPPGCDEARSEELFNTLNNPDGCTWEDLLALFRSAPRVKHELPASAAPLTEPDHPPAEPKSHIIRLRSGHYVTRPTGDELVP